MKAEQKAYKLAGQLEMSMASTLVLKKALPMVMT
jgi:hypothetical protein